MKKINKNTINPKSKKQKNLTFMIKKEGILIDFIMNNALSGISRNSAKSILSHRQVMVDNVITTKHDFELKPGMKVLISRQKGKKEYVNPNFKILFEDHYIIVVDKKPGVLAVRSDKERKRSVQEYLNEYVKQYGRQFRIIPLTSLDKEASGIMLYAKNESIKESFIHYWKELFKENKFVCVTKGEMEKTRGAVSSFLHEGKVFYSDNAISNKNGDRGISYYDVIKKRNGYSLAEVDIRNNRLNYIRMHMGHLNHPILGDVKNAGDEPEVRLHLHAFKLTFIHPATEELLSFETPYPSSFKALLIKQQEQ